MSDRIKFPVGAATVLTPAYAAAITCDAWNNKTQIAPGQLTGNTTFNLIPDPEIELGAEVSVKFTADGTNRTVSLGANLQGLSISVNANKIVAAQFEWDGVKFVHQGSTSLN